MLKQEPVSTIMTQEVHTINEDDELQNAIKLIKRKKIRHLPVMKGKKVAGILSRSDIDRLTFGALFDNQDSADEAVLNMLSISQVMTAKPRIIHSDDSIQKVAEIFAKEEYHALPVVDNWECKGIVTTTDVIAYLLKHYD